MPADDNVSARRRETLGLLLGAVGVVAFSGTFPATHVALRGFDAGTVGAGRAVVAAALGAVVLGVRRQHVPWQLLPRLAVVASGVVVGFPLLSALALEHVPVGHGAVLAGLLPAATAVLAVLRAGERPSCAFWLASGAGLAAVLWFALERGGGSLAAGDVLLLCAIGLGALGYAEGGVLARTLGGPQVICLAVLVALPVTLPLAAVSVARHGAHAGAQAWLGFGYVSVVSQFAGFFAWYEGLARGGVARVGQVQLVQPVLTLLLAAVLLGETVGTGTALAAVAVVAAAGAAQRTRVRSARVPATCSSSASTTSATPASPTTPPTTRAPGAATSSARPSPEASPSARGPW